MTAMRSAIASTSETMWVERITMRPWPSSAEQVAEAHPLLGVEPHRRLVDDEQLGVAEQRLRDADALAHAAREARPAAGAPPAAG